MKLNIISKQQMQANLESGEYDKDYMKIRFNSDDDLPLNKTLYFII